MTPGSDTLVYAEVVIPRSLSHMPACQPARSLSRRAFPEPSRADFEPRAMCRSSGKCTAGCVCGDPADQDAHEEPNRDFDSSSLSGVERSGGSGNAPLKERDP